jgi:predicted Fe-Mo cluster-binding NifX family protein
MKKPAYAFCMSEFKTAIGALSILIAVVLSWSTYHCYHDRKSRDLSLVLTAAVKPPAGNILVKAKMRHPYWGNCNKCHITTNVPASPVSKVFAGPPVTVDAPMTHEYWGNCNLCHIVTGGFQLPAAPQTPAAPRPRAVNRGGAGAGAARVAAAAAVPGPIPAGMTAAPHADWGSCKTCHKILPAGGKGGAQPVAFNTTASGLGLRLQGVTADLMVQLGLPNEDGALVLEVTPGSPADKAGFMKGDEIMRAGTIRVETLSDFARALAGANAGSTLKINIYRGKRSRNLFLNMPGNAQQAAAATTPMTQNQIETQAEQLGVPKTQQAVQQALRQQGRLVAAAAPMTQNQIETQAEQLGVPKTQQAVQQALRQQRNTAPVAQMNYGKVVVAAMGTDLNSTVATSFSKSPYYIIYDPVQNIAKTLANPNYNDLTGSSVQSAQYMVDLGASNVIAGNISAQAAQNLSSLRLNAYSGISGQVGQALNLYRSGQLHPVTIIYQQQPQARAVAAATPMTQNQIETQAEQLGVPKTQQAVQQALQKQNAPSRRGTVL